MAEPQITNSFLEHSSSRKKHWNQFASRSPRTILGRYYHRRLEEIYFQQIIPGLRIIEIGCGAGDLLASLKPSYGVGVDFSEEMIRLGKEKHPGINFILCDAHSLELDEKFDIIIVSELLNDLWDVELFLTRLQKLSSPGTRIIFNLYSRVWEIPVTIARKIGIATPLLEQNWLTVADVKGMLNLTGFETIRNWPEILFPIKIPLIAPFLNKILAKIWPFHYLALTNFIVARLLPSANAKATKPLVSIIVAARNEEGNIKSIFDRTQNLGMEMELIFVEGGSSDNTYEVIERYIREQPERNCKLFRQRGIGKGDAVRLGFEKATGDILMILDADLTVPPESLPRFYKAITSGKGEFINGVRLVYPLENEAMRFFNLLGNKFFSLAFSWLLDQPIKDTLCGTKVLWKKDYENIVKNRSYFGDFDPFGDFDLLFGAAKLNLKIIEIPIRYARRTYGDTNIDRWRHGYLLLKMTFFAIRKFKFI